MYLCTESYVCNIIFQHIFCIDCLHRHRWMELDNEFWPSAFLNLCDFCRCQRIDFDCQCKLSVVNYHFSIFQFNDLFWNSSLKKYLEQWEIDFLYFILAFPQLHSNTLKKLIIPDNQKMFAAFIQPKMCFKMPRTSKFVMYSKWYIQYNNSKYLDWKIFILLLQVRTGIVQIEDDINMPLTSLWFSIWSLQMPRDYSKQYIFFTWQSMTVSIQGIRFHLKIILWQANVFFVITLVSNQRHRPSRSSFSSPHEEACDTLFLLSVAGEILLLNLWL